MAKACKSHHYIYVYIYILCYTFQIISIYFNTIWLFAHILHTMSLGDFIIFYNVFKSQCVKFYHISSYMYNHIIIICIYIIHYIYHILSHFLVIMSFKPRQPWSRTAVASPWKVVRWCWRTMAWRWPKGSHSIYFYIIYTYIPWYMIDLYDIFIWYILCTKW